MNADDLLARYSGLRAELNEIDEQLATRGLQADGSRLEGEAYVDWRRRAIRAKYEKTRALIEVKRQLQRLQPGGRPLPEPSTTRFWRRQAVCAIKALEEITLHPQPVERATAALAQFRNAVASRRKASS